MNPFRVSWIVSLAPLLAAGSRPSVQESSGPVLVRGEMLELNFDGGGDGITLEGLIRICQEVSGQNFTFTDDARGNLSRKVRVFGKKLIPKARFYSFFQTLMKMNDFVCVELGNGEERVIQIVDLRSHPQNKTTVAANGLFLSDPKEVDQYANQPGLLVTATFPLKYQDANRLQASLRQYLTDQQMERVFNVGSSAILVTSFGPTVHSIKRLLEQVEVASRLWGKLEGVSSGARSTPTLPDGFS